MSHTFVAILLMAGEGSRFGSALPKQLHHIGGKPIFLHTLAPFLQMDLWSKILLVCPPLWKEEIQRSLDTLPSISTIEIVSGGTTRQESSYLALKACPTNTDYVVIHDGVRPFISLSILQQNIATVLDYKAVDTCIPSTDTLVHKTPDDLIRDIPDRQDFLRGQTPQSFSYPLLLEAHEQALKNGIINSSDDCRLVLQLGHPIKIVAGEERNIKITTEFDMLLAERLLSHSYESKISPSFPLDLTGKVFAVTGATGGIGQAICTRLKELGALPIEISTSAELFQADLTDDISTQKLFEAIEERYGLLDGLINSVGSFAKQDIYETAAAEIQKTIASNFTSVIYACKWAKLKTKGHIINISSSSYSRGRKEYPIYSAMKAALVNFTQGLADAHPELHINVIVPQRTNTPLRRENFPTETLHKLLEPQEIADKIVQILQENTITGSIVEVRKQYDSTTALSFLQKEV